jgi:hypothetical protein
MSFVLTIGIAVLALIAVLGMASPAVRDALVKATRALPASTTAVTSGAIDTGKGSAGDQVANVDFLLSAPVATITQLPDTKTFTYAVIMSDDADLSSSTTLYPSVIVQTGATGGSAAAATFRFRIPSTAKRYIGFTVTPSASGTGDASAATATLEVMF